MNRNIKWIGIAIGLIFLGMVSGIMVSPQNISTTTMTETTTAHSTYTSTFSTTATKTTSATTTWTKTTTLPVTSTTTYLQNTTVTKTETSTLSSGEIVGIYFSPKGDCARQVAYWISRANSSVHVLIYSFTLSNIGDALIQAKNRGIDIKVVFEKSQVSQYSQYFRLSSAGLNVRNDTNPDLMHDKVAIIDGYIVITGSFNWSNAAENDNNENLVIIRSDDLAGRYETVFQQIWKYGASTSTQTTTTTSTTQPVLVVITLAHYDAEGNDWYNLNDEYIEIRNVGGETVSLKGWQLVDLVGHTFIFPEFSLLPGGSVTVYTGSGVDTRSALYWGSDSPIWNNDHDTAYLYDQNKNLVDEMSW